LRAPVFSHLRDSGALSDTIDVASIATKQSPLRRFFEAKFDRGHRNQKLEPPT